MNTPAGRSDDLDAGTLGAPTPLGGTFETTAVPAAIPKAASGTDAERIDTPTTTPAFDEEALERRIVDAVSDRLTELLAPVLGLAERMEALEQKIEKIDTERERPSADTQALALRVETLERQFEARTEEDPSSAIEQPTPPAVELHPALVAELRLAQTMLVAFFLMMDGEHDNIEPIARHLSTWIEKAQPIVPEIVARFGPAAALEPQCTGPPDSGHPRESDA
ncbi:MAG: hypothetical protein R3A51_23090 [Nannocystaceae bacterium]